MMILMMMLLLLLLLLAVVTFAIDRLGLFGPNVMAAHMTQLTNEEIKLLAATQVRIRSKPITCLPVCLSACLTLYLSIDLHRPVSFTALSLI
jgi:hypothetical protein